MDFLWKEFVKAYPKTVKFALFDEFLGENTDCV